MARILTIDDDPDVLAYLTLCLASAGHEVHALEDSSLFEGELRDFRPELVVLDIMMPGATGGSLYNAIRQSAGPLLPIIISSASSMKVHTAGQDDLLAYYRKPAATAEFLATVERLLGLAQTLRGEARK